MKCILFSSKSYDREYFEIYAAASGHSFKFFAPALDEETAYLAKGYDAVCAFVNDRLNETVLKILAENSIKLIALRCAGFNNVDLKSAQNLGIKIVRVPAYSPEAVAEHAAALILTLNRKTHKAYNRIKESNFSLERLTGFNLAGKTCGVIGTGRIGSVFCRIMKGFSMQVIASDPFESAEVKAGGAAYVSLDELYAASDIISLHCPLTPDSKHIINKETLAKMKQGVMIINTSRGALINTRDAITALKSGKLGYLGIDVYEQEEKLFFKDLSESIIQDDLISRLVSFPNVLVTSHQAFFTKEALTEITRITLDNLTAFEKNLPLTNEVRL